MNSLPATKRPYPNTVAAVLFPRFISTNHVIKAYFFPTRSQLQEKKNLTLRFILHRSKSNLTSEDLNSRHDIITKDVDVRWTYGPYLLCPQHIFLSNPKTGAQNSVVAVVVVVILVSSTSYPPFEEKEN